MLASCKLEIYAGFHGACTSSQWDLLLYISTDKYFRRRRSTYLAGRTDVDIDTVVMICVIAGSTCVAVIVIAGRMDVLVMKDVIAGRICVDIDTEVAVSVIGGKVTSGSV